jgi:hypothetical protein
VGLTDDISPAVFGIVPRCEAARDGDCSTGTIALFFVVAASTGLVPGVNPSGHDYDG